MKNMTTRKRVSFGSKGSMVETWIIQDLPPTHTDTERHFYRSLVDTNHNNSMTKSSERTLVEVDNHHVTSRLAETNNNNPTCLKSEPRKPVPPWPLKRTQSLESRDNPFLPGGELEKEADDLLKHAVIIRDKFYLDADGNRLPYSPTAGHPGEQQPGQGPGVGPEHAGDLQGPGVVEETMTAAPCTNSQAVPEAKRRENGKVSEASPDKVKVDLVGKDGQGGGGAAEEEAADPKDKKKRNKCCSVM